MCGIHGFLSLDGTLTPDVSLHRRMGDITRHRGPDDEGSYVSGGVLLGMRRLSVIDVAGGHQPIANEDQSVWAVCNGEIYNFRELREQLAGRTFYVLEANAILILAALYAARSTLLDFARQIGRRDGIRLAAVCGLALVLVVLVAPRTNRIFYDEDIYQDQGHNLADLRRAQICNEGNLDFGQLSCNRWEYNKWPSGFPRIAAATAASFSDATARDCPTKPASVTG